jgi:superfamily II RNA helicase
MKQEIDEQFAKYAYLQDILTLAKEKSSKDYECRKPAVVRSFYLKLILQKNSPVEFIEIGNLVGDINLMFGVELGLDMSLFKALHHAQNLTNICKQDFAFPALAVVKKQHTDTLYCSIQQAFRFSDFEIKLQQIVKVLKEQLPEQDSDQAFNNWWKANGKAWSDKLINVMNSHRNIGLDLQFREEQKELIQEYYYANKLLVDCLKSRFDVSADVKKEIEETLLLPFDEMEKRQKQM